MAQQCLEKVDKGRQCSSKENWTWLTNWLLLLKVKAAAVLNEDKSQGPCWAEEEGEGDLLESIKMRLKELQLRRKRKRKKLRVFSFLKVVVLKTVVIWVTITGRIEVTLLVCCCAKLRLPPPQLCVGFTPTVPPLSFSLLLCFALLCFALLYCRKQCRLSCAAETRATNVRRIGGGWQQMKWEVKNVNSTDNGRR